MDPARQLLPQPDEPQPGTTQTSFPDPVQDVLPEDLPFPDVEMQEFAGRLGLEIPEEIAQQYGTGAFAQLVARGGLDQVADSLENVKNTLDVEPEETSPFSSVLDTLSEGAKQDYQDILEGRPTTARNLSDDLFEKAMAERSQLTKLAPEVADDFVEPMAQAGATSNLLGRILRQQQQQQQEDREEAPSQEVEQQVEQNIQQDAIDQPQPKEQLPSDTQPEQETMQEATEAPEQLAPEITEDIAPQITQDIAPQITQSLLPQVAKTATGAIDTTSSVLEGVGEGVDATSSILEGIGGSIAGAGEAFLPALLVGGLMSLFSKLIPDHEDTPAPLNPSTQFL